jgi:hypothetical protein
MAIPRSMILNAAALAVSISTSYAGPCPLEIERMRACIDAKLAARPSAPESIGAMMHRQPTRASVAAAEERLAQLSAHTTAAFAYAMKHARGRQCRCQ